MIWVVILIGLGALIGVAVYYKKKENAAVENGTATKRGHDFFRQIHSFKTKTASLDEIYQNMDRSALEERRISSKIDTLAGKVIFQNLAVGGSFIATLKLRGQEDGLYLYSFLFNEWKAEYCFPSANDELSGNIVLTSIEKAIVALDSEATITREFAKGS